MCDCCMHEPCAARCPNAQPRRIAQCAYCKEDICAGDWCVQLDDRWICGECVDEMSTQEAFFLCGYPVQMAKEE